MSENKKWRENLVKKRILQEWLHFLQHELNWTTLTEYHNTIDNKVSELVDRVNKLPHKK